jgi:hypothetical protein
VTTARVTETTLQLTAVDRDDFADEPVRAPRRPPYRRAEQRRLVRQSLALDLHTHAYDREAIR